MKLHLLRFASGDDATLGAFHMDGRFECFSLEDEKRTVKVFGETRIPPGLYEVKLRSEGALHEKYKARFDDHAGMLWLQSVPGFEWVYLHIGNTDDDTAGCILVGDQATSAYTLGQSVAAYRRIYRRSSLALIAGERVEILVEDL